MIEKCFGQPWNVDPRLKELLKDGLDEFCSLYGWKCVTGSQRQLRLLVEWTKFCANFVVETPTRKLAVDWVTHARLHVRIIHNVIWRISSTNHTLFYSLSHFHKRKYWCRPLTKREYLRYLLLVLWGPDIIYTCYQVDIFTYISRTCTTIVCNWISL